MAIARNGKSADSRMREIAHIDGRFRAYGSPEWAELLGCLSPNVRQTDTWAEWRQFRGQGGR